MLRASFILLLALAIAIVSTTISALVLIILIGAIGQILYCCLNFGAWQRNRIERFRRKLAQQNPDLAKK